MKILATSDLHGKKKILKALERKLDVFRPDLVILAGDIVGFRNRERFIMKIDKIGVPLFTVNGNSDSHKTERMIDASRNIRSLHMRHIDFKGFRFLGIGGAIPLPFFSLTGFRERREIEQISQLIRERSVLVTHVPPRGVLDSVFGKFPSGSRGIKKLITERKPILSICGHIHEQSGVKRLGDTIVVNCAASIKSPGFGIEITEKGILIDRL